MSHPDLERFAKSPSSEKMMARTIEGFGYDYPP